MGNKVVAMSPCCMYVVATSTQSIAKGGDVLLTYNSTPVVNIGDLTYASNSQIEIGSNGFYEIYAHASLDEGSANYARILAVFVNDAVVYFINNGSYQDAGSGTTWRNCLSHKMYLEAGDIVTAKIRYEDAGAGPLDTNPIGDGVALGVIKLFVGSDTSDPE